jgi:CO dehydrogenase nickel-insertion accessory protein CooC1
MNKQNIPLSGKKIGILGKGGSGKSTFTLFLAKGLSHRYPVCLLDVDSTNVGMHALLGIKTAPKSLLDYFGGMVFSGGQVTCPVDDPTPLLGAELRLEDLPPKYSARSPEGITLLTTGKIGGLGPGAGCDGPISKIARDLRVSTKSIAPVLLMDFKAGFEDTARGVITGLDWIIVVVDPTMAAIEMAIDLRDAVDQIQKGIQPATAHIQDPQLVALAEELFQRPQIRGMLVVLNQVDDDKTEEYLKDRLAREKITPITTLHQYPEIKQAWLRGQQLPVCNAEMEITAVIEWLEEQDGANMTIDASVSKDGRILD